MEQIIRANISGMTVDIVAISVQGSAEKENQDYFQIFESDSRLIVTVADGLGSAVFSSKGSRLACEKTIEIIRDGRDYPSEFVAKWKEAIGGNYEDYDTTIRYFSAAGEYISAGCIGDGWTYVLSNNEEYELYSEHVFLNCTESVMSIANDKYYKKVEFKMHDNFIAVIATDGFCEDLNMNLKREIVEDFSVSMEDSVDKFAGEIREMLNNWPCSSNHDDKTVVIIRGKKHEEF